MQRSLKLAGLLLGLLLVRLLSSLKEIIKHRGDRGQQLFKGDALRVPV